MGLFQINTIKKILSRALSLSAKNFILLASLYFVIFLNDTLWTKIFIGFQKIDSFYSVFFFTVPVLLFSIFVILFSFVTIKYITKPLFIFLIISSAMVNYGSKTYGIMFNSDMMVNIFDTTSSEASAYLNFSSFIHIVLTGFLPAFYVLIIKINYNNFWKTLLERLILIAISLACILCIALLSYKDYASFLRNNPKMQKDIVPTYFIGNGIKYFNDKYFTTKLPYTILAPDASHGALHNTQEKYLFVVVVGETARADNYSLNGYHKPTNAFTDKIKNLVYFKNVSSCGTATAVSLPCMFSNLTKDKFSIAQSDSRDNITDILKHAGYNQIWLDNNTGCKGICSHIQSVSSHEYAKKYCHGNECKDKVLLNMLDDALEKSKGKDSVIYLHLIGSHGPAYFLRYPRKFAKFLPDCHTSDLTSCSQEEIINAYDNTILYSDYILSQVIKKLEKNKNYHSAVFYVSDHGESLGENGLYLHGMPYAFAPSQQTHIPLSIWFSESYLHDKKIDLNCLNIVAQKKRLSHDNFFHTLLDLTNTKTKDTIYNIKKSILYHCKNDSPT
jgi:lipid A ethanolaminephosphotransferase